MARSVFLSLIVLFASGCDSPKQDAEQKARPAAPAPASGPEHAAAGVKPGSHEDWCGEHEVPESLCTRCNPALIAAFKASNDWCVEHDLPESQCRLCNPELKIVRPPPAGEAKP
ncbi:hypothetical protein POL25_31465 [Nannocystis sp. bb15-2]|uniref:Uncharacterized protein n=1 Tax=Nannocystis bainbridge TaxID=2995303 RepID=A0ABT5E7R7_9BACT|nr:hypothetical protein [Nannocystis bainbridge]